jgi:translation elongation factor EF-4
MSGGHRPMEEPLAWSIVGLDCSGAIEASAKTGVGIDDILE